MKTSAILRKAKQSLPRYTRSGICGTLWSMHFRKKCISLGDLDRVTHIIEDHIKPFGYADDWLAWHMAVKKPAPKKYCQISAQQLKAMEKWISAQTIDSIQLWRVEWLERMAVEFESKGD